MTLQTSFTIVGWTSVLGSDFLDEQICYYGSKLKLNEFDRNYVGWGIKDINEAPLTLGTSLQIVRGLTTNLQCVDYNPQNIFVPN